MITTAVLHVRNEEEVLRRCFDHLLANGLDIAVLDNESDDRTAAILDSYGASEIRHREIVPFDGTLNLPVLLARMDAMVRQLGSDWIVYAGADEILQSPIAGETLVEGIARLDARGYTAINFHEYVFVPTSRWIGYEGKDYVRGMRHYYFFQPLYPRLMRAWRFDPRLEGFRGAGHRIGGQVILAPEDWILRHYIVRSFKQAKEKYARRSYSQAGLARGWHNNRVGVDWRRVKLPRKSALKYLPEGSLDFDRSDPWNAHFWQQRPAGARIEGPSGT